MCGIGGIWSREGAPSREIVAAMADALAHRGPDDRGEFADDHVALGHLRLSILDTSPAGHQPMERHGCRLIHNGEVYNYLELAVELRGLGYAFTTETDSEVILHAYDAWGPDFVRRLEGMWAFAIWDPGRRRLLLSRDRFGIKPLYYRRADGALVFASEVRALLRAAPLDPGDAWRAEPDPATVRDFLLAGLVDHADRTFIEGIRSLPAAHQLVIEDGSFHIQRYWGPPALGGDARVTVRGTDARRDRDLVVGFRDRFDASVRRHLRADVPIGTCLSGGLDSSSVLATASTLLGGLAGDTGAEDTVHEQAPRFAIHARFPAEGVDESAFASIAADAAGARLVHVSPPVRSFTADLLPVIRAQGEPVLSTSLLAQFAVMRTAHEGGLKVLLDGQGGDELLGGYVNYLGTRAAGLIRSGHLAGAGHQMRAQSAYGRAPSAIVRAVLRSLVPSRAEMTLRGLAAGASAVRPSPMLRAADTLRTEERPPGSYLSRQLWQDFRSDSLPALLRYEDRNSMAFGIEARVPFLDRELVEYALALPDRLRIAGGETKVVLRRAMEGRVPAPILARRDKIGFATPERAWLESGRAEIRELVRDGQSVRRGFVDAGEVVRLTRDAAVAGSGLWRLFALEAWLRLTWPEVSVGSGREVWLAAAG
jgi:asparagine synthase (glutamine-hydrolysing)